MSQLETPPLSNGYVAQAINRLGHDPADAKVAGCYAIKCNHPGHDLEALTRRWLDETGKEAPYLTECAQARAIAYVGASGNIFERLVDHTDAKVRKSVFLQVFEPAELLAIYPDKHPMQNEQQYADALQADYPDWYVHCR